MNHYCTKVAYSETSLPCIEWDYEKKKCSVYGINVSMAALVKGYQDMQTEMGKILTKYTDGHSTNLPFDLSEIIDNKVVDQPEFSFLSNQQHDMRSIRMRNIQSMLQNGYMNGVDVEGKLMWNKLKMQLFMKDMQHFNELMMVMMHLGGGQVSNDNSARLLFKILMTWGISSLPELKRC